MRRRTLLSLASAPLWAEAFAQFPDDMRQRPTIPESPGHERERDQKLPNGKSQKDAIARENHQKALDDTNELIRLATQLQEELKKAGDFVVPVSSVKRTEDIEKLARRIRGRLRG